MLFSLLSMPKMEMEYGLQRNVLRNPSGYLPNLFFCLFVCNSSIPGSYPGFRDRSMNELHIKPIAITLWFFWLT